LFRGFDYIKVLSAYPATANENEIMLEALALETSTKNRSAMHLFLSKQAKLFPKNIAVLEKALAQESDKKVLKTMITTITRNKNVQK
jgi:hypothetical protein